MDGAPHGLLLVIPALLGALAGLPVGVLLARWLTRRDYRYDDEQHLPARSLSWVPVAVAVPAALVAAGQVPDRPALGALLLAAIPLLVALSAIDLDTQRLPDRFVKPGIVVAAVGLAVVSASEGEWEPLLDGILAGAVLGGFYLANVLLGDMVGTVSGMGLGDAKLGVVLGLLLGPLSWAHVLIATVLAFVTAGVQALWLVLARGGTRATHLAFGPHMVLGALVVLCVPGALVVVGARS